MTIYLRYKPDKVIDREKYLNTYSGSTGYKMLQGTPLLVSVEGTYIKANDIPSLLVSRKYAKQVNDWLLELRNPPNVGKTKMEFKWRR